MAKRKRFYKTLLIVCLLLLLTFATQQGLFEHVTDSNWVAQMIDENGVMALWGLLFVGALFTAVGGPRQMIAFVFGFALGGALGGLLSTVAALIGCVFAFYFARLTIRSTLQRRFSRKLYKFELLIVERTWLKVLLIRLLPVGSNLLTNLFAGATHVPARGFIFGSFIGYLPQMFIFSFAGAGVGLSDHNQLVVSIGLFIVSSVIGAYLYRSRLRKQVDELVEEE
ncbi:VTT domain-containing protein [Shewanella sp. Isolate11]|uniref:TVP38/TMEM64 family protein n=1 Tax=Shewanella sp. Isolate11 TaxID=2908530 RepID=UPI001EFD6976|nr:VTT domain-containing protein [Shewanella sp. Isolate11]MCG9697969.1 VTT domain-containing protein [Shewanella sp. Isolate11]